MSSQVKSGGGGGIMYMSGYKESQVVSFVLVVLLLHVLLVMILFLLLLLVLIQLSVAVQLPWLFYSYPVVNSADAATCAFYD
jgi:hypothetical protein